MILPCENEMHKTAVELCEDADLLIGHFIHHPLQAAAEKSGKPYITVTLNHGALPTKFAPPVPLPSFGTIFNRLFWFLGLKVLNGILLPYINDFRKRQGLNPAQSFRDVWESPLCNLIAVSPVLCVPKPDWGSNHKICGFFRIKHNRDIWTMPEGLDRFLNNGPGPVYMTLGSMGGTSNNTFMIRENTELLYRAAKIAGCRAIIQSRWEYAKDIPLNEDIFRVTAAPYTEIFPKCAAVVHHGGAGTTQSALLSGCPSLIVAHIQDQLLWGTELVRLGVSPSVIKRQAATPEKIAIEIQKILASKNMSDNARIAGEKMRDEDGVTNAVRIIENVISN